MARGSQHGKGVLFMRARHGMSFGLLVTAGPGWEGGWSEVMLLSPGRTPRSAEPGGECPQMSAGLQPIPSWSPRDSDLGSGAEPEVSFCDLHMTWAEEPQFPQLGSGEKASLAGLLRASRRRRG